MRSVATIADALESAAESTPDRPYISMWDGELTFGQVFEAARRAAAALKTHGLNQGDRVAIIAGNDLASALAFFACALGGFIAVPINPALSGIILDRVLADSSPALMVRAQPIDDNRVRASYAQCVVVTTAEFLGMAMTGSRGHALANSSPQLPVSIMYTSGTTGRSKGAILPNGLYVKQATSYLDVVGVGSDDRFYTSLPLFHTNAQCLTLTGSLLAQIPCRIAPKFSASGVIGDCTAFAATVMNLLGAMIPMMLARTPAAESAPTLRLIVGGGVTPAVISDLKRRFEVEFRQIYGLTEVGVCAGELPGSGSGMTAGVAMNGFSTRIARGMGDSGEIQIKADRPEYVFSEYWNNPEATRAAYTADGWFRTGDLGALDDAGRLLFRGRLKDVIRRRGENIACEDLESIVLSYPAIIDCAAVPVASELAEDEIKLVYVSADDSLTHNDVCRFCRGALPGFMVPRYYERLKAIPRTPTFKVQRHELLSLDKDNVSEIRADS
jgi:crotonobetaine/carnitine-CoA ligase